MSILERLNKNAMLELGNKVCHLFVPTTAKENPYPNLEYLYTDVDTAKKILGKNLLGPEEIKNTFGINLKDTDPCIPYSIPYTVDQLKKAKLSNKLLVFFTSKTNGGELLDIESMINLTRKRLQPIIGIGENETLRNYSSSISVKGETLPLQRPYSDFWALVNTKFVPGSVGKNYLDQTEKIAEYLQNDLVPNIKEPLRLYQYKKFQYYQAIEEFNKEKSDIRNIMSKHYKKNDACEKLISLQINQLRLSVTEYVYIELISLLINNKRFLKTHSGITTRTYTPFSHLGKNFNDHLIAIGNKAMNHIPYGIYNWEPYDYDPEIGVIIQEL